ncbi:hypothetical protein [Methylobacterium sp. 391_Methyba4]|uniref:DUF4376 domain-containing protein n=1 Tax=Methylobacterium sp. 391_Methyba4 TaxID=3038924 RepID=UPI00241D1DCD|nr:hypothetical protein [Methylobacterium sp. 391_Methyba4]WFS07792.1 hypothetical protein P9K36_00345 [Methylobacterium sp. 391_Methyba4]
MSDVATPKALSVEADGTHVAVDIDPAFAALQTAWAETLALPPSAEQLVAHANARQWALATGGFTAIIAGQPVLFATDEASLAALDRKAMRLAQPNPPASVSWQVGPTQFATIAADDFDQAARLVEDFFQATFDALPAIFEAIASGEIKTLADVEAASWPASSGSVS